MSAVLAASVKTEKTEPLAEMVFAERMGQTEASELMARLVRMASLVRTGRREPLAVLEPEGWTAEMAETAGQVTPSGKMQF